MEIDRDEKGCQRYQRNVVKLKTVAETTIPEWLLTEVLVRLPVKLVFRFKLVSKQWLSVILDPLFVRMYISRVSKLQPWTFIYYRMHLDDHDQISNLEFPKVELLVDILSRDLIPPSIYALHLPCTQQPAPGKRYCIVGVSNGLVLYAQSAKTEGIVHGISRFSICNPVTGQWIGLPPKNHYFVRATGGFLTLVENGVLTSYRVVQLFRSLNKIKAIKFKVFLSEKGVWEDFVVRIGRAVEVHWRSLPTTLNGILHWVTREHGLIAYDPYNKPHSLRFIALPSDIDRRCNNRLYNGDNSICIVHQGRMKYVEAPHGGHRHRHGLNGLSVWILNDYTSGDWCLLHKISSSNIIYDNILSGQRLFLQPLSFHPFDSDVVYMSYKNIFVSYNMSTRKLEAHGGPLDLTRILSGPRWRLWMASLFVTTPWPIYIPPSLGMKD